MIFSSYAKGSYMDYAENLCFSNYLFVLPTFSFINFWTPIISIKDQLFVSVSFQSLKFENLNRFPGLPIANQLVTWIFRINISRPLLWKKRRFHWLIILWETNVTGTEKRKTMLICLIFAKRWTQSWHVVLHIQIWWMAEVNFCLISARVTWNDLTAADGKFQTHLKYRPALHLLQNSGCLIGSIIFCPVVILKFRLRVPT